MFYSLHYIWLALHTKSNVSIHLKPPRNSKKRASSLSSSKLEPLTLLGVLKRKCLCGIFPILGLPTRFITLLQVFIAVFDCIRNVGASYKMHSLKSADVTVKRLESFGIEGTSTIIDVQFGTVGAN